MCLWLGYPLCTDAAKEFMITNCDCTPAEVERIVWPVTVKGSIFESGAIERYRPTHVFSFCRGICLHNLRGCVHILQHCMRSRALQHLAPVAGEPIGRARCVTVVLMDHSSRRKELAPLVQQLNALSCVKVKLHERRTASVEKPYEPITGNASGSGESNRLFIYTGRIKKGSPELAPCSGVGCPLCDVRA